MRAIIHKAPIKLLFNLYRNSNYLIPLARLKHEMKCILNTRHLHWHSKQSRRPSISVPFGQINRMDAAAGVAKACRSMNNGMQRKFTIAVVAAVVVAVCSAFCYHQSRFAHDLLLGKVAAIQPASFKVRGSQVTAAAAIAIDRE